MTTTKADDHFAMGRYDLALEMYDAHLESNRNDANARIKRANVYLALKRYADASNDATMALRHAKIQSEALYVRGVASFWLKKYDTASISFRKALESYNMNQSGKYMEGEIKMWIRKCATELGEDTKTTTSSINKTTAQKSTLPTTNISKKQVPLKYEYYQTDKKVVVNVLEKVESEKQIDVVFGEQTCNVSITRSDNTMGILKWYLHEKINAEKSTWKLKAEKVVLKLKKIEPKEWPDLQGKAPPPKKTTTAKSKKEVPKIYSGSNKDWNSVDKWCKEELEKEKPQGEQALQKLFENIYKNADEDTRRAMNKSYQTSGGTVLSTNWGEVAKEDYEKTKKAPEGMEFRKWDE